MVSSAGSVHAAGAACGAVAEGTSGAWGPLGAWGQQHGVPGEQGVGLQVWWREADILWAFAGLLFYLSHSISLMEIFETGDAVQGFQFVRSNRAG